MIEPVEKEELARNVIAFQGFPLGLNTSVPPFQLNVQEMATCVDWKMNDQGQLESRGGICQYTTVGATGEIKAATKATIAGTSRTIVSDDDNRVYYLNGTELTYIDTAIGESSLFEYNDRCMVCDGSFLKFLDGITTSSLHIAYDMGSDGDGQHNNYGGTNDSGIPIYNGTNTRAAVKFTSKTWDAGFTMPVTQFSCFLKATGSPTGTITANLRLVSDDSILATTTCSQDASDISTDGEFVDIYFSSVTTEMSSATDYYATIEMSAGDSSNYISLRCSDNGDFTNTGFAYASAAWAADTGKNPIIQVLPGLPPKCSFGWVSKLRPWFAGDPDNPGYAWYGFLSHLDFSTGVSGGFISAIDDNNNSFAIGAGQDLYGEMFVYGKEAQPYLSRLDGDTPEDFTLPLMFQQSWATHKTIQNTGNDLWTASGRGVDALSGVQEYGDVRYSSASDRVKDKFKEYWDSDKAISGYHPQDGQYWLCLNHASYSKVLIGHSKLADFPWVEYDLPCTATSFGQSELGFTIGADDGHLYYFKEDSYKDLDTTDISPSFKTAYTQLPFVPVDLVNFQLLMSSTLGASINMLIYKDGNLSTEVHTYPFNLPMSDSATVDDLIMVIDDWESAVDTSANPMFFDINIYVRSFQIEVKDTKITGQPVYFNGCILEYRQRET